MIKMHSHFVRLLTCFTCILVLSPVLSRSEEAANLTGFDAESQDHIRSQRDRVFRWLIPFCSDLTPYLERENPVRRIGGTDKLMAVKACQHFQKSFLPDGWIYDGRNRGTLKDWVPNTEHGGTRYYRRVPNTICPVRTEPKGNPVAFLAWEHRKGDVKISILYSHFLKTEMVLVVHKDGGLGFAAPTPGELLRVAREYFQIPPLGLAVPPDWEPVFQFVTSRGRFISGSLTAKYSGEAHSTIIRDLDQSAVLSWGRSTQFTPRKGSFFYDGFNLALFVNPIYFDAPSAQAAPHLDVDWELVEQSEREKAGKGGLKNRK